MRLGVVLVSAGLMLCGCGRGPSLPLPQETFVSVMVELRKASSQVGPGPAFDVKREQILAKAGVTEAELEAHARALQAHPEALREAFDSIRVAMQRTTDEQ